MFGDFIDMDLKIGKDLIEKFVNGDEVGVFYVLMCLFDGGR